MLTFDYFTCMKDKVIVNDNNLAEHHGHDIVGEFFVIKNYKRPLQPGLISKKLINSEREKIQVARYEANEVKLIKKRDLEQKRFVQQLPDGAMIVNILEENF